MENNKIGSTSYREKRTNDFDDSYVGVRQADAVITRLWSAKIIGGYLLGEIMDGTGITAVHVDDCTVRFKKDRNEDTGELSVVNSDANKRQAVFNKLEGLFTKK